MNRTAMRKIRVDDLKYKGMIFNAPPAAARNTSTDPTEIVGEIQKAFHDFQAANDERFDGIAKRFDDVVTNEKVDRLNAQIDELKTALEASNKKIGRLTAGGGGANDNDALAAARKFFSIQAKRKLKRRDPVDLDAYHNYCDAFEDLVRSQCNPEVLNNDIRAALTVGSDPGGGYLVPTEMSTEIERRIFETSPMRQIARVITIGGGAWEAPYKSADAVSGGWVGELQARTSTGTPTVGMQEIKVHEQYAYPEVSQTMLDDAMLDVESFIVEETEDVMGRTENTGYVSGNGKLKARGFTDYKSAAVTTDDASRDWGVLQYVPTGASAGFPAASGIAGASDPDSLITLMAKLNPAYRPGAVFTMNRGTEATIRKMKDGQGRYLVGFGDLRDGAFGFNLLNTPIVNLEDMAAIAANSFSLAYGDFKRGYYIIDRTGFRVLRDPYSNKPYVGFYITKRTGGDVRNFDAIKLLKFGTS